MVSSFITPAPGHSISEKIIPDMKTTLNLFGMHIRTVSGEWSYPVHNHPQYEFMYLLEGEQLLIVNNRPYLQRSGDLVLLRPGELHSSQSGNHEPFTYFCIHFDIDDKLLISLLSRLDHVLFESGSTVTHKIEPSLAKLVEISDKVSGDMTMLQRMRVQSALFELFGQLWEAFSDEESLSSATFEKVELAHLIRNQLHGLVYQQFKQEQSQNRRYGIDDIAADLGISVSHCNRVFRQVYGMSPRIYLSEQMLHEAKVLLDDSRLSISHISGILGYRDIAHFSRQFKRWHGQSPREYRNHLE